MALAHVFEQPFGIGGNVRRGASSPLRRSQKRVRTPARAEVIDEYSGIEIDSHYAARRCVTSSSGVTTWGFSAVSKVFSSVSLVTKKSHSTALLRIRMSLEWAKRFRRARTRGSKASAFAKSTGSTRKWSRIRSNSGRFAASAARSNSWSTIGFTAKRMRPSASAENNCAAEGSPRRYPTITFVSRNTSGLFRSVPSPCSSGSGFATCSISPLYANPDLCSETSAQPLTSRTWALSSPFTWTRRHVGLMHRMRAGPTTPHHGALARGINHITHSPELPSPPPTPAPRRRSPPERHIRRDGDSLRLYRG
jgi:hypothetical protein